MGLFGWYHEGRIGDLSRAHPEVDVRVIRIDYSARLRGYLGMEVCKPVAAGRNFDYNLDLINSVDESFPERVKRFFVAVLDALLPVV